MKKQYVKNCKRYALTYKFFKTYAEAKKFCDEENATGTNYKRKNKQANFTSWRNTLNTENGFVAWYYV